mgnify:FL=1
MNKSLLIVFLICAAVFGPLATIWALNQLFHLNLNFDFKTWAAVFWLAALLKADNKKLN